MRQREEVQTVLREELTLQVAPTHFSGCGWPKGCGCFSGNLAFPGFGDLTCTDGVSVLSYSQQLAIETNTLRLRSPARTGPRRLAGGVALGYDHPHGQSCASSMPSS